MSAPKTFEFEVVGADGARRRGTMPAADLTSARDRLIAAGDTPLRLVERRLPAPASGRISLSEREAGDFAADLARLLNAGVPLVEALRASARISRTPRARRLADMLARRIEAGVQLSAALRETGDGALTMLAALAQVGERAGALGEVLRDAAETLRESASFRSRLLSLMLYPAAVAALTIVILLIFLVVVAPALRPIFAGLEDRLPFAAVVLFSMSDAVRAFGPLVLGGGVITAVTLWSTASGRALLRDVGEGIALSPLALRAPATAAFATYGRAISLALRRGVRLPQAHRLASEAIWARRLRNALLKEAGQLETGAQLSTVLRRVPLAPPALVQLAASGEAAGKLAPALAEAGAMLADDARQRAERLVALAGPAITLLLGGLVGLVVLTLFRALASIAEVAV